MTADLKLTRPSAHSRDQGKPPSLATDDRFLIRRCRSCRQLYRLDGFPITQHIAEQAYDGEVRAFGCEPAGTCPGCEETP
jgi:hypothetical protein